MSGANFIELMVYETDRDNASRIEVGHITYAEPDWDIDRAGSKGRLSIGAHRPVLRDGMWVATHLRIIPEVGEIVDVQTGHFRLDMPNESYDGSVSLVDGEERVIQEAVGDDIVRLLADADLPFTFVTPVNGDVMSDVWFLIKLATSGAIGKNLLTNGGFESGDSGWLTSRSPGAGAVTMPTSVPQSQPPEGLRLADFLFSGGRSSGDYLRIYRDVAIPPDTRYLMVSGITNRLTSSHDCQLHIQWLNASGSTISTHLAKGAAAYQGWTRFMFTGAPPDGAVSIRIRPTIVTTAAIADASRSLWDDIQVRQITSEPIPDGRINLSLSTALATTRIQTTGGQKIGPAAINADRLAAISHHAINATFDGTLTSSPSRDLASTTAVRTYTENDYRFRSLPREIRRSPQNRFNTVTAVKESFEDGVAPLVVTVFNDDPTDAWSVHHLGNVGRPGGSLQIPDAVDTSALEAAARAELSRATMQEELILTVAPDPELTVYDVIEITGGPEPLQGRWLIQALSGVTPQQPYTQIQARRSRSSVGVTHG